jgi:hypothetical protein
MRETFLLDSRFNFMYFGGGGGVGQFGNISVFDRYSNRSLIVHAVSYFACGVIDTACIFDFFCIDLPFCI